MEHVLLNDIRFKLEELCRNVEAIKVGVKPFLNSEDAAFYIGISKSTLYKHTYLGNIPFYKPNGKLILFKREELEAWVGKNRIPSNNELLQLNS